ncbi:MAG: PTS glucose transporter subunit IIA [Pseudonocardiaceae bacterium]
MTLRVHSPIPGRVLPLSEVTAPVFAHGMVGPGVALARTPRWVRRCPR